MFLRTMIIYSIFEKESYYIYPPIRLCKNILE